MKRWTVKQILALVLTVFVSVGLSLSVVNAGYEEHAASASMAATMTMVQAAPSCATCLGKTASDSGARAKASTAFHCPASISCSVPMLALLPTADTFSVAAFKSVVFPTRSGRLVGNTVPPEPYPPKSSDLV